MSTEDAKVGILVVDDKPDQSHALAMMLASPSRRVREANSGEDALLILLRESIAVLLVDVEMPGIDGYELAHLVRSRPRTRHLPILFVTSGYGDPEAVRRGYAAGAVDFLQKPLDPVVVRAKVDVFIDLLRKEEALRQRDERLREAERHEAELQLAELRISAARRFRDLADAMPQILFSTTPTGTVDYVNERWFAYTGLSLAAAGSRWSAAVDPEDADRCAQLWEASLRTGEPFESECRLVDHESASRWHLVRIVPQRTQSSEIESWLGTCTDIDEAKRSRVELTEFRGTLDAALECMCLVDATSLRLLYANQGASDLLGYARAELVGRPVADLTAELDEAGVRELMRPLLDLELPSRTLETSFRRRDGSLVPVELLMQFIRINGGRIALIARNIAARKAADEERTRLYEQAQAAVRVRDEFLAIASHELKTPLTTLHLQIQILTRALRKGPPDSDKLNAWLDIVRAQLARLGRLIDELLDVTRMSEGRLQLRPEDVDLGVVVRSAVDHIRQDATEAGSEVVCTLPAPVPGHWDALRLEQVITNLITNAIKYGAGGRIELETSLSGDTARVVVRDHGIGIASDKIDRVFDRFERAVSSTSYGGLGLGLYIARQIVVAHGGTIRVESEEGVGSTFTVELPLRLAVAQGEQDAEPRVSDAATIALENADADPEGV